MTNLDLAELGRRAEAMIGELGAISAEPGRLVRLYLTPEHRRAMDLVASWMRAAGLSVSEDEVGTLRGCLEGPPGARRLALGSHLDTVIDAGRYDGTLGVISALLAVEAVRRSALPLPFGIDVLAFGEEEGSRFPTTLAGSSAAAGVLDPEQLERRDPQGVSFSEALRLFGKDPGRIAEAAYRPGELLAYVELHIEQGPVLEREGVGLGVVSSIAGQSRSRVVVTGRSGHAGTVPMSLRQDALLAAAQMALDAERIAKEGARHSMVATVGTLRVEPGAANVIPSEAVFTLDLRAGADAPRQRALAEFEALARRTTEARGCEITVDTYHDIPTTPCADWLQEALGRAVASLGLPVRHLLSGAGHDGQAMARLTDIGMLFVRCRDGVSHHPAEFVEVADMGLGIAALVRFIEDLAKREPGAR